jgi:hypothetical protein
MFYHPIRLTNSVYSNKLTKTIAYTILWIFSGTKLILNTTKLPKPLNTLILTAKVKYHSMNSEWAVKI